MVIDEIKDVVTAMGLPFLYGNPSQINEYLTHVDYSTNGFAAFCYLLGDVDYENGKEVANVAVFFSCLMPFDFDGQQAIDTEKACMGKAKEFLTNVSQGNSLRYGGARFQFGHDDFAENVGWCAVRATFELMAPDCVPFRPEPEPEPEEGDE